MPLKSTRKLVVRMVSSPNSSSELPTDVELEVWPKSTEGGFYFLRPLYATVRHDARFHRCWTPTYPFNERRCLRWWAISVPSFNNPFRKWVAWLSRREREKLKTGTHPPIDPAYRVLRTRFLLWLSTYWSVSSTISSEMISYERC